MSDDLYQRGGVDSFNIPIPESYLILYLHHTHLKNPYGNIRNRKLVVDHVMCM